MRRAGVVALLLAVAAAVVVVLVSGDEDESYKVRAIFDNAGFIIPGEDVKVAGVKVGSVDSVDVTDDFKAAIVLDITDPGYQDFRDDASCIVRPQSLIGERFVECEVTQPRAADEEPPPPLQPIEEGPGEGQLLLPVEQNGKAVDLDLVNNIMQLPVRERLTIILSELGVGVAGRGRDLAEVIRRADPALREVDELLAILASQNRVLSDLARDSDTVLAPLARERRRVASAIENSSEVAAATAERRGDLAAGIELLPTFLRELRPTMVRLGALSDEMTPVLSDLGAVAPDINRLILQLGPFSQAGIPAFESLGEAAEVGTPAVIDARPVVADLRQVGAVARPVGSLTAGILQSFQRTDGIERFMDYIFYQVAGINGFDAFGHYLRAGLIVNQCTTYAIEPGFGCQANFSSSASGARATAAGAGGPRDPVLTRTAAAIAKVLGLEAPRARPAARRRAAAEAPMATPVPAPAPTPARATASAAAPAPSETEALMDYLFGKDAAR